MDRGEEMKEVLPDAKYWIVGAGISALLALFILIYVVSHTEPRRAIQPAATITSKQITLSDQTKRELQSTVNDDTLLTATTIITVDLIRNKRIPAYFYSKIPQMQAAWNKFASGGFDKITAFGNEELDNARLTNIMNGNFDCRRFKDTIAMSLYPDAEPYGPVLCSMPIPSGFDSSGDFVGLIGFFLKREPTDQEKKILTKTAIDASSMIYHRDVLLETIKENVK
jgi:hypothetical protein